jgi:[ribosomal protein S5]-alanine N-acetyltransferase
MNLSAPSATDGYVRLRRPAPTDVSWIAEACGDPDMHLWIPHLPYPYTEKDARDYLAYGNEGWASGTSDVFAIVGAQTMQPLGMIELRIPGGGLGDIGYWVRQEARGQGVATAALRLLTTWAIQNHKLQRVQLTSDPENHASQTVAKRAGFRREGLLRAWASTPQGRRDRVMFSFVPHDAD